MKDEKKDKLPDLRSNIGKSCRILESSIAGLSMKVGVIEDILGNDSDGYRYQVRLPEPLYSDDNKTGFYPSVFLCEIL